MIVRWSETAGEDLKNIFEYIARDKPDAARATLEMLLQAGEGLMRYPSMGRSGRHNGTRELVHTPFVIVYSIVGEVINIHAVLHGSRKYI
jgi:toxin ParE1/3/4